MPEAQTIALDSGIQDGCGLRVVFARQPDRFDHQVLCLLDGRPFPLLRSVEGTADERWPSSPPFQQLSLEQRDDGSRLALLVGMAGKSHWSASVQLVGAAPSVSFDIACRAREQPQAVSSCYYVETTPDGLANGQLSFPLAPGRVALLTMDRVGDKPAEPLRSDGSQIMITPSYLTSAPPVTIRWGYRIEVVSSHN